MRPGITRITGEIVTGAPAEVVFGFAADQRNEPACNPHARSPAWKIGGTISCVVSGNAVLLTAQERDKSDRG